MSDRRVTVRFSEAEYQRLKAQADAIGVSVAEIVRARPAASNEAGNGEFIEAGFALILERIDQIEERSQSQIAAIQHSQREHDEGLAAIVKAIDVHLGTPRQAISKPPQSAALGPAVQQPQSAPEQSYSRGEDGGFMRWFQEEGHGSNRPDGMSLVEYQAKLLPAYLKDYGHDIRLSDQAYQLAGIRKPQH